MEIERYYRVSETAALLSEKEPTLRKWILLRKIPYVKIGRTVRIPESAIRALLAAGRVPARPEAK